VSNSAGGKHFRKSEEFFLKERFDRFSERA
jgi:hypothetical protein